MKIRFVLFILILSPFVLQGQDSTRHVIFGLAPMYGIILPHHPEMKYLVNGHIPAGELEIAFTTDGSKPWHHSFNFPTWGFDLDGYYLSSPYLGYAAAARIFYDLPLNPKRSIGLKMGIGLAYVENPFDMDDNYHNLAIGSTLNAALALNFYGKVQLSQKWVIKPGIGIHHFSNGAYKMPNAGINLTMLNVVVSYDPKRFEYPTRKKIPFTTTPGEWLVGTSYGMKEIYPINGPLYSVVNLFGIYQKQITNKSSFGGELGVNYNASLEHRINDTGEAIGEPGDNFRAYLAGLFLLHFDPIGIRFEVGTYLFPQFTDDGMIFFRYDILYNIGRFQIFAGLKSHFAKADNCEIGLSYKLK